MVKVFEGKLTAKETDKFCIVISRFNDFIGSKLLQGALDAFIRHGVKEENIDVVWVPGAFEIPLMCKKMAKKGYGAIVVLQTNFQKALLLFHYLKKFLLYLVF